MDVDGVGESEVVEFVVVEGVDFVVEIGCDCGGVGIDGGDGVDVVVEECFVVVVV